MTTFTAYLPSVEEALLEQLVERAQLPQNRVIRLAVRALYIFAAEHGFDGLESRLELEARRLAKGDAPLAGELSRF